MTYFITYCKGKIFSNASGLFLLFLFLFSTSLEHLSFPLLWLNLSTPVVRSFHKCGQVFSQVWSGLTTRVERLKLHDKNKILLTFNRISGGFYDFLNYLINDYSSGANIGSQEGSMIGFCSSIFMISAGTYFFSITTRNMYSLNHSSVIIKFP